MRGRQRLLVILTPVIAIALALLVGAVIIAALGRDPVRGYVMLFYGSLGSPQKIAQSLVTACPLIFTSLAAAFAYKCGVFNLGGEGQFIMGAVAAAAFCVVTGVEGVVGTLGALAVGAAAGAAWGALPGVMKVSRGLNEMITSIMLNYVATLFMGFVYTTALRDGTTPQTPAVAESVQMARMSDVFRIHPGVLLAIALALVLYYVMFHTSFGFKIRAVGMNEEAARVNGFPVRRLVLLAFVISGAVAGLGGSVELLGKQYRLMSGFGTGFGFDGVAIALIAQLNPLGSLLVALFFGVLRAGSIALQISINVPTAIVDIIQALVIIFAVGGMALLNYPKFRQLVGDALRGAAPAADKDPAGDKNLAAAKKDEVSAS